MGIFGRPRVVIDRTDGLLGGHRDRRVDAFHYFYKTERTDRENRVHVEIHKYLVVNVLIPVERPTLTVGREMWAYDVLHPRMMEHLLADSRATDLGWPFRFERGDLYTWEEWPGDLDMAAVMDKADYLIDILQRVPDFVWKD